MINQAKESWDGLAGFRRNRDRCRDYTFGRQWNDPIEVDGRKMTEYEYIVREGNIPLKNNLIRRIVRNVLGVFRKELPKMMGEYGGELAAIAEENSLEELFCRSMEEFLISGMVVHRKGFGFRDGRAGVWTETVSPGSFFFNPTSKDVRGWDVDFIGEFHHVSFRQWCSCFVRDEESFARARKLFGDEKRLLRVTEVWRRELVPRLLVHDRQRGVVRKVEKVKVASDRKRWILDDVWRYYFLTDDGSVICSGDSPYRHGGHPFVFKCYPFLDGEIQSFVGDMIDQQRYANRLITLYDWMLRASAKGVLLLPKGAVEPEDMQGVADQWSRFNGVIVYNARPGMAEPHQVNGGGANMGVSELLDIQLKMLEDVSGVTGTLRGNISSNSVSGTLYNQQTENAMNSLSDIMHTFGSFIAASQRMDMSLLHQTLIEVKNDK